MTGDAQGTLVQFAFISEINPQELSDLEAWE